MLLEHAPDHVRCKRRSHEIVIPSPSGLLQLPVWVGMERCLFQPALIAGVEGPMFQAPDPHQSLGGAGAEVGEHGSNRVERAAG